MFKNAVLVVCLVSFQSSFATAQALDQAKVIAGAERAFDKVAKAVPGPGCAVGVSVTGQSVFEKACGMAEMEHGSPNTPQPKFESGSVAKQFTAAALVLLQQDGKLSIDDPVRKHIPELPDYGTPLTIRHILNHTAGLRDWGSVMALTGAGRGDRVITQDIALDVIIRQKALDFTPGAEYSYSNSGYNLAAIIVERVSKQKFGDFLAERLLKPLGMKNTSLRDDYRRLVPGRAQAYSRDGAAAPWRLNMPIMNVYGNGGMLTTVGDWLKWNEMLDSRSMGAPLVEALETRGVLNDGRKNPYALGLINTTYKGIRDISHGGSTAGYQTFLARYPDQKLSVAVLCNGTSPSAGGLAASVTDEILGPFPETAQPETVKVPEDQLKKFVGLWRNERNRTPGQLTVENGTLRFNGNPMRPIAEGKFMIGTALITFTFEKDGRPINFEGNDGGDVTRFAAEREWTPTSAELASLAGEWYSDEAGATFLFAVEGDKAFIVQRPAVRLPLRPLYNGHFGAQGGYVIWFTRDAAGKIDKMHVGTGRMRDMPFERVKK